VPALIKYTQRRRIYRVKPPVLEPAFCEITGGKREKINDISSDGFSIITNTEYSIGNVYRLVKIHIPGSRPVRMDGKCVYSIEVREPDGKTLFRYGFEFTNRGFLEERTLMRYVSHTRHGRREG
jgi:c-di-GMP-binding flagellar brake protein YcgR